MSKRNETICEICIKALGPTGEGSHHCNTWCRENEDEDEIALQNNNETKK
jgi:hypothetical protein